MLLRSDYTRESQLQPSHSHPTASTENGKRQNSSTRPGPGPGRDGENESAPERRPFAGETGHFHARARPRSPGKRRRLPHRERAEAPSMACSRPTVLARQKRGWSWLLVGAWRRRHCHCRAAPCPFQFQGGVSRQRLKAPGLNAPPSLSTRSAHTNSPAAGRGLSCSESLDHVFKCALGPPCLLSPCFCDWLTFSKWTSQHTPPPATLSLSLSAPHIWWTVVEKEQKRLANHVTMCVNKSEPIEHMSIHVNTKSNSTRSMPNKITR